MITVRSNERSQSPTPASTAQVRIIYALMMHDIKSRFFGNGFGYAIMIAWPLLHILVILAVNAGRIVPRGASMVLYAATAVIPWVASNYIGRFIMLGVLTNKSYLQYPIIKPLDLMVSRAALEIVSNAIVVITILIGMSLCGIDVVPHNILQACMAWGSSIFLGVSLGFFGGAICLAYPMFNLVFVLFIIVAWATCGIGVDPELLPEKYGYYLSFNPVMHVVEWMRQSYFLDAPTHLLNKTYLLSTSAVLLAIGLIVERLFKAFLTSSR